MTAGKSIARKLEVVARMRVNRKARLLVLVFSVGAAAWEYYSFAAATQASGLLPLSSAVLFLCIVVMSAFYERMLEPIDPAWSVPNTFPLTLVVVTIITMVFMYHLKLDELRDTAVYRRLVPRLVIGTLYVVISMMMVFGDDFMWPLSKWLKMGRPFTRRRRDTQEK